MGTVWLGHQTIETTSFIAVMPVSGRFFDYLYCSYDYVNIIEKKSSVALIKDTVR